MRTASFGRPGRPHLWRHERAMLSPRMKSAKQRAPAALQRNDSARAPLVPCQDRLLGNVPFFLQTRSRLGIRSTPRISHRSKGGGIRIPLATRIHSSLRRRRSVGFETKVPKLPQIRTNSPWRLALISLDTNNTAALGGSGSSDSRLMDGNATSYPRVVKRSPISCALRESGPEPRPCR